MKELITEAEPKVKIIKGDEYSATVYVNDKFYGRLVLCEGEDDDPAGDVWVFAINEESNEYFGEYTGYYSSYRKTIEELKKDIKKDIKRKELINA